MDAPLVGRDRTLKHLVRALAGAAGRGMLVAGAAGMGKTRLLLDACRSARAAGHRVELVTATSAITSVPFGAVAHVLPPGCNTIDPAATVLATADHLRAGRRPVALAVDDAQLLDPASTALLRHLLVSAGVPVVATVRAGDPAGESLLAMAGSAQVDLTVLDDLDEDAVTRLVEAALGGLVESALLRTLRRLGGGNPMLLGELVHAGVSAGTIVQRDGVWSATGPVVSAGSLPTVVAARLDRLDPAVRAAAELVALAEPVGAWTLERILPAEALAGCESEGLLVAVPDRRRQQVRLVHPLYAECLRATVPPLRAREHYRRLADALRATGMRRGRDRVLVALWQLAAGQRGDPELLLAAARDASAAHDHDLAARLAQAAADGGGGHAAHQVLLDELPYQGRTAEAMRLAARLRAEAPDRRALVRVVQSQARLHLAAGDLRTAESVLAEAVRSAPDPESADWLLVQHADLAYSIGAVSRSLAIGEQVLHRPGADQRACIRLAATRIRALCAAGRISAAHELGKQSLDRLDELGERRAGWHDLVGMASVQALVMDGRLSESVAVAEAGVAAALEGDAVAGRALWVLDLAQAMLFAGRPRTAGRLLRETLALMPVQAMPATFHLWGYDGLAEAAALCGNAAAAVANVDQLERAMPAGFVAPRRSGTVWAVAAAGELSRARAVARQHADQLGGAGAAMMRLLVLHDIARLGGAREVVDDVTDTAAGCGGGLAAMLAANAVALAARDAAALDEVAARLHAGGFDLMAAESAAAASRAYRAAGHTGSGYASATRARELAAGCEGASTPLLGLLDEPPLLTGREREIAGLAATGLTDKEIADRLQLSVRTVHSHLHRSYRKLGISDRAQLNPIFRRG